MSERKPLTLEELRKMDGKPVKVVCDESAKETTPGFKPLEMICLVEFVKSAGCVVLRNNVGGKSEYYNNEELEQDGLTVYQYEPPRLDRSAWEPCEFCGKADFGEFGFEISKHYAKIVCALGSWRFPKNERFNFCPKCGCPLTDSAWDMLERRLAGHEHQ